MSQEIPVLFNGPMVRAILSGQKTQTRRRIKPQPPEGEEIIVGNYCPTVIDRKGFEQPGEKRFGFCDLSGEWSAKSPLGRPGDVLWVRETWAPYSADAVDEEGEVVYRASYDASRTGDAGAQGATKRLKIPVSTCVEWSREIERYEVLGEKWRPSIHMPRSAARIFLEVKAVRAEPLQEMTEADAIAEGCPGENCYRRPGFVNLVTDDGMLPQEQFRDLWECLYGPESWAKNEVVAVYEFEQIDR